MNRANIWMAFQIAFLVFFIYFVVAMVRYQFAHPEKTDTERFLEIGSVLTWD